MPMTRRWLLSFGFLGGSLAAQDQRLTGNPARCPVCHGAACQDVGFHVSSESNAVLSPATEQVLHDLRCSRCGIYFAVQP